MDETSVGNESARHPLEVEKWLFERDLRARELELRVREQSIHEAEIELKRLDYALRERDQTNRDREVDIKHLESRSAKWRNPLIVAVLAAALAAAGNAVVAFVNGASQRDLEKSKQEAERILEMIKTGGSERAAERADVNLRFLLESGLVSDSVLSAKLFAYLDKTKPGSGPLLPSASTRIGFDEATPIDQSVRRNLETIFAGYLAYLDKTGFPPAVKKVVVQLEPGFENAAYDGEKIIIDDRVADDPSTAIREYTHHVLLKGSVEELHTQHAAIEGGLADYFACSFLNSPKLGEKFARIFNLGNPYIRNLKHGESFASFAQNVDGAPHGGMTIWGGLFWQLREQLGAPTADKLLAASWQAFNAPKARQDTATRFAALLVAEARKLGETQAATVAKALRDRAFPYTK